MTKEVDGQFAIFCSFPHFRSAFYTSCTLKTVALIFLLDRARLWIVSSSIGVLTVSRSLTALFALSVCMCLLVLCARSFVGRHNHLASPVLS